MPAFLVLDSISLTTPDGRPLFDGLTLAIVTARTGCVGRNGCGKSSLLRLIAGEIDPASGSLQRLGSIGMLSQLTDERLTIEEALVATCLNPAWLSGDERRRGKLLPGYLADLVVLSRDPLACPPDELETVEVVATMVGGRWVHHAPPW